MHQPDIDVTLTRPDAAAPGTPGWFRKGDASQAVKGSIVTADFLNDLIGGLLHIKANTGSTWTKGAAGDGDLAAMFLKLIFPEVTSGIIRLGTGHFLQFGFAELATGNGNNVSLPVAYPNTFSHVMVSDAGAGCYAVSAIFNGTSKASFLAYARNQSGVFAPAIIRYITWGW